MKSRIGIILAGGLVMLAFSAIASASASAAEWMVAGSPLSGEAGVSKTTKTTKAFVFNYKKELRIACTTLGTKELSLKAPNTAHGAGLLFSGCASESPKTTCIVESKDFVQKQIEFGEVVAKLLVNSKGKDVVEFTPKGSSFGTLRIKECGTINGTYFLDGEITGEVVEAGTEAKEKQLSFGAGGSRLELGEEAFEFTGEAGFSLTSGLSWSVR